MTQKEAIPVQISDTQKRWTSQQIANTLRHCSTQENGADLWLEFFKENLSLTISGSGPIGVKGETFQLCKFDGYSFFNLDFTGSNFKGADFSGADIRKCIFYDAILVEAKFIEATIGSCNFSKADVLELDAQLATFNTCKFHECKFRMETLKDVKFLGACEFRGAELWEANLDGVTFDGAIFTEAEFVRDGFPPANLESVCIRGGSFSNTYMSGVKFSSKETLCDVDFRDANLGGADLSDCHFLSCNFDRAVFSEFTVMQGSVFEMCGFSDAKFVDAIFKNVSFRGGSLDLHQYKTDFSGASMRGVDVINIKWNEASFKGADCRGATIYRCCFSGCDFSDTKVDKFTLETLRDQGVSKSDELVMMVEDDLARLRIHFSGVWTMLHLFSLLLFLSPYMWLVIRLWPDASFSHLGEATYIPLWKALALYIYNGGQAVAAGIYVVHYTFYIFCFLLLMNGIRAALVIKTKSLEHVSEVSGQPSRFSFSDTIFSIRGWVVTWGVFVRVNGILLFINVVFSSYNFIYFMGQYVPLEYL